MLLAVLAVAAVVDQYLKPLLVGKNVDDIEDIWQTNYVASKAGVIGLTRSLAFELGKACEIGLHRIANLRLVAALRTER